MEGLKRGAFQGVLNIVRFNWHLYAAGFLFFSVWMILCPYLGLPGLFAVVTAILFFWTMVVSLVVSWFVYDRSHLYETGWLKKLDIEPGTIVNIHAGFDETSALLSLTFPMAALQVMDFYDPDRHTEVSIRRARRAYPSAPGTIRINTSSPPVCARTLDAAFLIFAAHEIRDERERRLFLSCLRDGLVPGGKLVVVEHLRDWRNFLAYTVGFFHFFSAAQWKADFSAAGLMIRSQDGITPFVRVYVLERTTG